MGRGLQLWELRSAISAESVQPRAARFIVTTTTRSKAPDFHRTPFFMEWLNHKKPLIVTAGWARGPMTD